MKSAHRNTKLEDRYFIDAFDFLANCLEIQFLNVIIRIQVSSKTSGRRKDLRLKEFSLLVTHVQKYFKYEAHLNMTRFCIPI